jgi:dihydroflavonol-4-reductase
MKDDKALVLGASGFLGSHVVKALVAAGRPVRILTRASSNTVMTDHLDLDRQIGDVFDRDALRKAMTDCSSVFYCIVDTRAWLRDSAPLYQTNVEGSRLVMEVALEMGVERFVFTSSVVAVGLNPSGVASEADEFNWEDQAPAYVMTRVKAERQLLDFCRKGLPGVVCNVGTTFGGHDHQPTPHGELLKLTVARRMPVHWNMKMSVVGIKDAADALLLAERHGKAGERYIITDRMMDIAEATSKTAAFAGVKPPRLEIPMWLVTGSTWAVEKLMRVLKKDTVLTMDSILLSGIMGDYDNSKARSELGWQPRPMDESLKEAAIWFKENP